MKRLTVRTAMGAICNATPEVCNKQRGNPADDECCCYCNYEQKMLNKLADYEDAEDNGLLLRLPCKVGDTVYQVNHLRKCVSSFIIKAISVTAFGFWIEWELLTGMYINLNGFNSEEIGKTVFLTREEAEQALADMLKEV